jgi:hypothetical protein
LPVEDLPTGKTWSILDRHGLSLSEIEMPAGLRRLRHRHRAPPTWRLRRMRFSALPPSATANGWDETTTAGSLRHLFFGLQADVEAAHFLDDLIGVTFDTETARFKFGAIYTGLEAGERRTAVNSIQTGLSQGIGGKLKAMRTERDAVDRASSRRDLVPLKTSVIDDELAIRFPSPAPLTDGSMIPPARL